MKKAHEQVIFKYFAVKEYSVSEQDTWYSIGIQLGSVKDPTAQPHILPVN